MASEADQGSSESCGQYWGVLDTGTGELRGGRACFSWRCPVCGPKRKAEATEMLRLRIEGWKDDPEAAPNFVTLTGDPANLPPWIELGSDEEDGMLRGCFQNVLRRVNWEETRAGRPRLAYVAVIERGAKTGNWHVHVITDREIHVTRWRKACASNGLGTWLKAKRLNGARGAANYLAKYLHKGATESRGRGRRVLLHSRYCLPSLALWRWMRANREGYRNASTWTRRGLRLARGDMAIMKGRLRRALEEDAVGALYFEGHAKTHTGWETIISRRLKPSERPEAHDGVESARTADDPWLETDHEATSEPSQPPHGGFEVATVRLPVGYDCEQNETEEA